MGFGKIRGNVRDGPGPKIDDLQRRVLTRCAEWAAAHPSVSHIYVFGSIARGDCGPASDVDIFVRPELGDMSDHSLVEDSRNYTTRPTDSAFFWAGNCVAMSISTACC
jgi:Polymerase beta, Nucleotidyltransferase